MCLARLRGSATVRAEGRATVKARARLRLRLRARLRARARARLSVRIEGLHEPCLEPPRVQPHLTYVIGLELGLGVGLGPPRVQPHRVRAHLETYS